VPVRGQQGLLDGQAGYLASGQAVAGAPAPLRELLARLIDVVASQRQMDVGERNG
jgi:hypothetical protein